MSRQKCTRLTADMMLADKGRIETKIALGRYCELMHATLSDEPERKSHAKMGIALADKV